MLIPVTRSLTRIILAIILTIVIIATDVQGLVWLKYLYNFMPMAIVESLFKILERWHEAFFAAVHFVAALGDMAFENAFHVIDWKVFHIGLVIGSLIIAVIHAL